MTRLIDGDALEKAIYEWMPKDQETWMDSDIPPIENLVVSIMMTIQEQQPVDAIPVHWLYDLAEQKENEKDIKLSAMIKGVVALWHMEKRNEKRNNCKELVATET